MPNSLPTRRRLMPHLLAVAGMMALPVLAQGVYRIVGPDGRVTYSDQPPPANTAARPVTATSPTSPTAGAGNALPFELRQTAGRFPVVLYTSADCNPCRSGIAYLERRGIPFTEKSVQSRADIQALERLSGGTSLPLLTVGNQQLRGFAESDWKRYLDVAGYPAQSALPASYRRPAATPLVSVADAQPPAAPTATSQRLPAQPSSAPASAEPAPPPVQPPAGIRF